MYTFKFPSQIFIRGEKKIWSSKIQRYVHVSIIIFLHDKAHLRARDCVHVGFCRETRARFRIFDKYTNEGVRVNNARQQMQYTSEN